MEKPSLAPSIIIAVALVASSLMLSYSLFQLGDDVIAAGIYSRKISLQNANGTGGLRVVLDEKSELKIESEGEQAN